MIKHQIVADPRVANDLKEARDFLNSRRKGLGSKFLKEYKVLLKTLQSNPDFQVRYKNIHCLPLKTFKYMVILLLISLAKQFTYTLYFQLTKILINIGCKLLKTFLNEMSFFIGVLSTLL
jgi:hypothetical protein